MSNWKLIDKQAMAYLPQRNEMFVVKAINVYPMGNGVLYTSDPYCVWIRGDEFVRWPHPYAPTHYCLLPEDVA